MIGAPMVGTVRSMTPTPAGDPLALEQQVCFALSVAARNVVAVYRPWLEPMGLTRYKVAKLANVQQRRIDEICAGKRAITADTALRLAKLFGMDAQTWMNLQAQYDLETVESELGERIKKEVSTLQLAA